MRLAILGPPGAGKGTQAGRLAARTGICHISTGDALRNAVMSGTGTDLHAMVRDGSMAPDELVAEIIESRIQRNDCRKGYILDGFPRTERQLEMLKALTARLGHCLDAALLLDAPEEELMRRIVGRMVCLRCRRSYHLDHAPPLMAGICDSDGEPLTRRPDDTAEVARKRLRIYERQTRPLIERYRAEGLLEQVGALGCPDKIEREIEARLRKRALKGRQNGAGLH